MKHPDNSGKRGSYPIDDYDSAVARYYTRVAREAQHQGRPLWRLAYAQPDPARGFTELESARHDLIALAESNPVAAASRVRAIQRDQRRVWLPRIWARLHPPRPRLNTTSSVFDDA